MKIGKLIIVVALWVIVVGLGYWLYTIIQDPVQFEKDYNIRHASSIERLEDIRTAQEFYLKANGKYASNFDELLVSLKNDLINEVVINGNADDTSVVTTYDTLKYLIKDKIQFVGTGSIDSLRYIPFSGGEEFDLQSDILKLQRVEVPVYEVVAPKSKYLKNTKQEYWDLKEDLVLGSVLEATDKGNWE